MPDLCCDHLHGCGDDDRHFHQCCGHWHGRDRRPHSRACGIQRHDHGPACSSNCPTCHGRPMDREDLESQSPTTCPPMPTSQAEWEVHWAFYRLTVAQRDAAWREIDRLKARNPLEMTDAEWDATATALGLSTDPIRDTDG